MTGALRAVLFDAVGTLIRLREPVGESYARAARAQGAPASAEALSATFARAHAAAPPMVFPGLAPDEVARAERAWWRERVRETFESAGVTLRDPEACFARLWSDFARPAAWRVLPEAEGCLDDLRTRGLARAVVSNFDGRLPDLLATLGLGARLDAVVLPGEAGAAKPDPAILRFALARLGCAPAEAALVGDDPLRDLAPARALGLLAIDVRELATLADLPARLAPIAPAPPRARFRP